MEKLIVTKISKLSKFSLENFKGLSYSTFRKALRNKDVKVNGKRVKDDIMLNSGDVVEIYFKPIEIDLCNIIYQDENLLVIDKKAGFTYDEVFKSLKEKYENVFGVHRLDRNTSGLMLFALNNNAEKELLKGFKNHSFVKIYKAVVSGFLNKKEDTLTAYLVKDSANSLVKIFNEKVKGSSLIKTGYKVVKEGEETSELEVRLYTGKTHQIRAHLSFIGHPLIGDGKYGDNKLNKKLNAKNLALRSYKITLFFDSNSSLSYLNNKTFMV